MLRRHSGCIVADVVGLGKSIIGVTIAANAGLKTIIICPPHVRPVSRMGKVLAWGAADYHIGRVLFKRRHRRWYIGKVKFYRFMGKIGVVNI
jgi:hypothetical protein